jgi:hypothetical protein
VFGRRSDLDELERENRIVGSVVQALVGAISPNVLRISVEFVGRDARLHVVLAEDLALDREEFEEDLPTEVEALLLGDINDCAVTSVIHLGSDGDLTHGPPGRAVFGARRT